MKKVLSFILIFICILTFCSCGLVTNQDTTQTDLYYEKDGYTIYKKYNNPPKNAFTKYTDEEDKTSVKIKDITYTANSSEEFQNENGIFSYTAPKITKTEKGKTTDILTFKNRYIDFSAIATLSNGNLILIGCEETAETKITAISSPTDIVLIEASTDGKIIKEKSYGGSDYDYITEAYSLSNGSFCCVLDTQSDDGTFKASPDGIGVAVIAFFDESLNLCNFVCTEDIVGSDKSIAELDNSIFVYTGHTLSKYSLSGKKEDFIPVTANITHNLFVSNGYLFFQSENDVTCYNSNLKEVFTFDMRIESYIDNVFYEDETVIILSGNTTGTLPTTVISDSGNYTFQSIISAYKTDGTLLWRDVKDIK